MGVAGNYYFFTATTAAEGEELWLTDGTETGTKMVKDIRPGTASAEYANFTEHKGKLYFLLTMVPMVLNFGPQTGLRMAQKW